MAQQHEIQSTVYTLSVAKSVITEPRCGLKTYLRHSHALEMEIFHASCFSERPDNITPRWGALRLKPVYQEGKLHCQRHPAALHIWIISLWCSTKAAFKNVDIKYTFIHEYRSQHKTLCTHFTSVIIFWKSITKVIGEEERALTNHVQ